MYYVYAIKSVSRNYIYVGLTRNLKERIRRHNCGYEKKTKPYRPYELIFSESHPDLKSVRIKEKYYKSGCGKEFLKRL